MSDECEACGWMAAIASMLAFGSFGAPIKSEVVSALDVDPLVFQTYKTAMCFLTSWLVLLMGQTFTFTPWGIVSGCFWVPGGVATIFAVKTAGLAVGIGVGSSFIVLVSFVWGIFIFSEAVKSKAGACIAVGLMIVGIIGMSHYADPENGYEGYAAGPPSADDDLSSASSDDNVPQVSAHESEADESSSVSGEVFNEDILHESEDPSSFFFEILGCSLRKRTVGILAAVFNGTWGGSIMVPMHFSSGKTHGIGYVISFSIGASVITILLWVIRYLFTLSRCRSFRKAFNLLPAFHFSRMWPYGCTSGLLWSIGNFFSVISVQHLGEGVGYSVIQAAMLISGLWGIFFFREISRRSTILKWFVSAFITVGGILLLSYEHHS